MSFFSSRVVCLSFFALLVFFSLFFQSTEAQVNVDYSLCDKSANVITIGSVTASSWPPKRKDILTLTMVGDSSKIVKNGQYSAATAWSGITIKNDTGSLTDLNITLPIQQGALTIVSSAEVSSIAPSGKYVITFQAYDQDGDRLWCVLVNFSLSMMMEEEMKTAVKRKTLISLEDKSERESRLLRNLQAFKKN